MVIMVLVFCFSELGLVIWEIEVFVKTRIHVTLVTNNTGKIGNSGNTEWIGMIVELAQSVPDIHVGNVYATTCKNNLLE